MVRILLTVIHKRHVFDNPNLHSRTGFMTKNIELFKYSPGSRLLNRLMVPFIQIDLHFESICLKENRAMQMISAKYYPAWSSWSVLIIG